MKLFIRKILTYLVVFTMVLSIVPCFEQNKSYADSYGISNPRVSNDEIVWDCIYFGTYPQTEVVANISQCGSNGRIWECSSDCIVDTELYDQLQNSGNWGTDDICLIGNCRYRRIKKGDALFSDDYAYAYKWADETTYHYFRFEPIKWRVLNVNGEDALLLADIGIDTRKYNETYRAVTWKNCTLRSWLNGYGGSANANEEDYTENNFLSTFSSSERNAIYTTNTNAEYIDNSNFGTEDGNNTNDKIFLLSSSEMYSGDLDKMLTYGFLKNYGEFADPRMAMTSTYAKAMGIAMGPWSNMDEYRLYSSQWQRSNFFSGYFGASMDWINAKVSNIAAVRPALRLNLSSSVWTKAETKTLYKYKIYFNKNATDAVNNMDDRVVGSELYVKLPVNLFKRTGYTFGSWNTNSDGTGVKYSNGEGVLNLASNKNETAILYAQWKPITYKISFHRNSVWISDDISGEMESLTMAYDVFSNLPENSFKNPGYTFDSWNTKWDGTGTKYLDKASVKNLTSKANETIVLLAQWKPNTYTVKFNKNATDAVGTTNDLSCTYDVAKTLTTNGYTRTGYTFDGWSTNASGTGTKYADKASVKNLTSTDNGTVTLYAQWKSTGGSSDPGTGGGSSNPGTGGGSSGTGGGQTGGPSVGGDTQDEEAEEVVESTYQIPSTVKDEKGKKVSVAVNIDTSKIKTDKATVNITSKSNKKLKNISLTIPKDLVSDVITNSSKLEVATPVGSMIFDSNVLKQAGGGNLSLSIGASYNKSTSSKATQADYSITLKSGSKKVSKFGVGVVKATLPIPSGLTNKNGAKVLYNTGKYVTDMNGVVSGNNITFNTNHFSKYSVMTEKAANKKLIKSINASTVGKIKALSKNKKITLTWKQGKGNTPTAYGIYRSNKKKGIYNRVGIVSDGTNKFVDTYKLKKGKKYYYRISGVIYVGNGWYDTKYSTKAIKCK